MGGHSEAPAAGHGHGHAASHGHHGHHDHHHHAPRVYNSVIKYDIPDAPHHVEDFKIPDYKRFKVENAPKLVKIQDRLASLGLKDPWLRNEVWRFDSQFGYHNPKSRMLSNASTGMKWGLVLAVGVILAETVYNKAFGKGHGHGHGHH